MIEIATAIAHLRLESDYPPEQVQIYLDAAESVAAQFLNRRIYPDSVTLTAARSAVTTQLTAAASALETSLDAADLIEDTFARSAAREDANEVYRQAQIAAVETRRGVVINAQIEAAILLVLGHLFENRQDVQVGAVSQLPIGSQQLLFPFRIGLGV